ncbi:MBL fold metallo-hydrolase [Actinocorallia populi]|uniref:MBL fold metallo-hydrolase n=1 Tax=Actinocorallia populi TaxID=2079200 RepID=UPI000D08E2EC|nr:MBL fold metallo-hydrolase [Actinocorallia populi]
MPLSQPGLVEVAQSVYAYVQPDGGWCLNNAGLVVDPDCVLLVDTTATERRTKELITAIETKAPHGPDYLVNTHFHGDHTFGNSYFRPRATIIAHADCARDQILAGPGLRGLWPDVDWGGTPVDAADITYTGNAAVHVGDRRVSLLHSGPAHTSGDTIVWLPDDGVLFAGDVVWAGTTPFCLMGSVTGSLAVIEELRGLGPRTVVPGHGPVGGPELLDQTERYLSWLMDVAIEGVARGRTVLEAAAAADLGEFGALLDSERIVGNLHRAYAELDGMPQGAQIDVGIAFAEMVEFHGSLPSCHA